MSTISAPLIVLCVDDDADFCEYLLFLSKPYNISLDICGTVQSAKAKIEQNKYDAYIFDIQLPDGTGIELAELIRKKEGEGKPIVVISGVYRDPDTFRRLKEQLLVNYVIDKPLQPNQAQYLFAELCQKETTPVQTGLFKTDSLKELKIRYQKTIPDKVELLTQLVKNAQKNPSETFLIALMDAIHKIGGTAGSYGFTTISTLCKSLEQVLIKRVELIKNLPPDPIWLSSLDEFLQEIKFHFQVSANHKPTDIPDTMQRHALYIIDSDQNFLDLIESKKDDFKIDVVLESDPNRALDQLSLPEFNPRIIIVDQTFPGSELTGYDIIELTRQKQNPLPTAFGIFLSSNKLADRVEAIQKGIEYVFQKPIYVDILLERMQEALRLGLNRPFKVLVVDDNPDVCQFISLILADIGFEVRTLSDGTHLYEALESEKPQLLLLDILMPGYDGLTLLKTLRADIRYQKLIVIIITAKNDPDTRIRAYTADADDIIFKPLEKVALQKRILNIGKRHSLFDQLPDRSQLTGLHNIHSIYTTILEYQLQPGAMRGTHYLSIFEIEKFNDLMLTHRRSVIDSILISISNLFSRTLERDGICAMLNETQFAVLFDSTNLAKIRTSIDSFFSMAIREIFNTSGITIKFNCGITSIYKNCYDVDSVFKAGARALFLAGQKKTSDLVKIATYFPPDQILPEKKKVCLVDGDNEILQILQEVFVSHNLDTKSFNRGKDALEYLLSKQSHQLPALIITERHLDDMDGLYILKKLRSQYSTLIPVFILSKFSSDKDVFEGIKGGALDYIPKPFDLSMLVEKSLSVISNG